MIKTIIFDNNGVLTSSCQDGALDKLVAYLEVPKEEFLPIWEREALDVDEGKITSEQFIRNVLKTLKSDKDFEICRKYYWSSYEPKQDVRDFAKRLDEKFEIAFLTNFSDDFWKFNEKWKLDEIFPKEKMFISAEMKMRKPHEDIYYAVLEKLGRKPEEVIFVDDKLENIETAKKIGMQTIQFKTCEEAEKDLEKILEYDYV